MLISLALVTWYSIERIPYCVQLNSEFLNDENLMGFFEISYTNWIGSHNIYLQQNIFYMAIPILATLPFGSSFYDDINRGYARNVCVRAKKKYYLVDSHNLRYNIVCNNLDCIMKLISKSKSRENILYRNRHVII